MKKILAILTALSLLVLTACSSGGANVPNSKEPVQGGIESGDGSAAPAEESSAPENIPNDGPNKPESYGSGDFQEYWQRDDYFDLEGYLWDNGAAEIWQTDGESWNPTETDVVKCYMATFTWNDWEIRIGLETGVMIEQVYIDSDGFIRRNPAYGILSPIDYNPPETVVIDSAGHTTNTAILIALDYAIQHIYANPTSDDPLKDGDFSYYPYPM